MDLPRFRIVVWEPPPLGDVVRDILEFETSRTSTGKFDKATQDLFNQILENALEGCHVTVNVTRALP